MTSSAELRYLVRYPVVFKVAADPADSQFVFSPRGRDPVPLDATEAIGVLSAATRDHEAHPTNRAWAGPALIALRLMARGHLRSPEDSEVAQLHSAAAGLPYEFDESKRLVNAFLKALAVNAPAAAMTPQKPVAAPRPVHRGPEKQFKFFLRLEFEDHDAESLVATATLSIQEMGGGWGSIDVAELWARGDSHRYGSQGRRATINMLKKIEDVWPPAARLLHHLEDGAIAITADQLASLADGRATALLAANRVEVHWPRGLMGELDFKPVVSRIEAPGSDRPKSFSSDQLFAFDWTAALGDDKLTKSELDELAGSQTGLLKLRDRWVFIDPKDIAKLRARDTRTISAQEALRVAATGTMVVGGQTTEVDTVGWLEQLRQRLAQQDKDIAPAAQPEALVGTLREYQLQGLRWLTQLVDLGLGGCLADDMGLGKTVMLIALHLHRAETSTAPTLVVCPASVLGNWQRELERFAPGLPVRRFHGPGRDLDDAKEGFVLTTYGTMRIDAQKLAEHAPGWGLVVADEAQNVKNPRARTAQALRTIGADACIALTGTPVENNLSELWSILDWTTPGLLGTYEEFRRTWSRSIERYGDDRRAAGLAQLIRPFVLRRRKSDPGIAPELPPKTETDHDVHLTREQVGLYEAVVRDTLEQIRGAEGIRRRGLVVKLLTQLKQICNHPAQYLRQPAGKLTARSGKFQIFDELVTEIVAEDGAILVFTQYAQMGHLIVRHLNERKVKNMFLHGQTPVRRREQMVRRFQSDEVPVFILSLRAAGVGLNLTRADHVIHFDRWWNPAVEDQATDRAHRIGQTKPVQVHRLISEGTIEESIGELIKSKRALADAVVNGGEGVLTELSDADLAALVQLRRSPDR